MKSYYQKLIENYDKHKMLCDLFKIREIERALNKSNINCLSGKYSINQ